MAQTFWDGIFNDDDDDDLNVTGNEKINCVFYLNFFSPLFKFILTSHNYDDEILTTNEKKKISYLSFVANILHICTMIFVLDALIKFAFCHFFYNVHLLQTPQFDSMFLFFVFCTPVVFFSRSLPTYYTNEWMNEKNGNLFPFKTKEKKKQYSWREYSFIGERFVFFVFFQ